MENKTARGNQNLVIQLCLSSVARILFLSGSLIEASMQKEIVSVSFDYGKNLNITGSKRGKGK